MQGMNNSVETKTNHPQTRVRIGLNMTLKREKVKTIPFSGVNKVPVRQNPAFIFTCLRLAPLSFESFFLPKYCTWNCSLKTSR
jgi:hypothetical protein